MSKAGFSGKPESAIKRADEFIEVEKYVDAIDVLFDVLRNKRHRDKVNEQSIVINKFCQLCVDHEKTTCAKDGLYQFKGICSQNVHLFHSVVERFLNYSSEKLAEKHSCVQTRTAYEKSIMSNLVNIVPFMRVDELDVVYTPEDIICQLARSSHGDGNDNLSFISFMRFNWDNYRNMLDLVKNNKDHEKLYQDIAKRAMDFCNTYRRKAEFRKLCEILRGHLILIQRHQEQETSVDLTQVDSIQKLMDIRLDIIETAIKIDSCQEAFKALEECHHLIELSRAARTNPRSQLLAGYFEKQATVYLMANDMIFHAAALTCAYLTFREDKRFLRKNPDFFKELASRVVLATLSAPHTYHRDLNFRFVETEENFYENEKQLSSYLYLSYIPTRKSLLNQIQSNSILESTPIEVKRLYQLMTSEPLIHLEQNEFSENILIIEKNKKFSIYIPYLKIAFAIELIIILSKYYENISFSRLHQTINFLDKDEIETCLITIFKYLHYHVKIDHNTYCVKFPHSTYFPISDVNSNTDSLQSPDFKLSQLKHIHSQLSKCIINYNNNELVQAYQSIKNNSKEIFISIEKDLNKIFARRRNELENLQSQLEQRKINLPFQFQIDSLPPYTKPDVPGQGNLINGEKPIETENIPQEVTYPSGCENPPNKINVIKNLTLIEKTHAVIGKPKLEDKPKDPNRYRQNEKSLDFIFRAQRQKEIDVLFQGQKDRTHILSEKWCVSERNRVRIARDLYTEKIILRDRFSVTTNDINLLTDEIMDTRLKSSQESINLLKMFDHAKQICLDEHKKIRKLKQKQTNKRNNPKNQPKPVQNRPQELVNTPKGSQKLQSEPNLPHQRNTEIAKTQNTSASPGVYMPPHLKNKGKQS